MKQSKKKNQNKAKKYKIQQNTQLHLAPMLHEKKRKIHMDILFNLAYFLNIYFC